MKAIITKNGIKECIHTHTHTHTHRYTQIHRESTQNNLTIRRRGRVAKQENDKEIYEKKNRKGYIHIHQLINKYKKRSSSVSTVQARVDIGFLSQSVLLLVTSWTLRPLGRAETGGFSSLSFLGC
jgi:hypothetical protein